jgi:hypothetical protein
VSKSKKKKIYYLVERDFIYRDNDAQLPSAHNSSVPKSSPMEVMKRRHVSCDSVSSSHG